MPGSLRLLDDSVEDGGGKICSFTTFAAVRKMLEQTGSGAGACGAMLCDVPYRIRADVRDQSGNLSHAMIDKCAKHHIVSTLLAIEHLR